MEVLAYAGIVLTPRDVATSIATAASGRVPQPRRGRAPTDDPADWLVGLVSASQGTALEEPVRRALHMVLRTGNSKQLSNLTQVAREHLIFEPADLVATLERRQIYYDRETAHGYAAAIGHHVASGQMDYDPILRMHLQEKRLRAGLVPAYLVGDRVWCLDHVDRLMARNEAAVACAIRDAFVYLSDEDAAEVRTALSNRLADLPELAAEALKTAMPSLTLQEDEVEEDAPQLDPSTLPWRSRDGRWFVIPDAAELPAGALPIRRGWVVRRVRPDAIARFEIGAAEAEAIRGRQVAALWDIGRRVVEGAAGVKAPGVEEALGASAQRLLKDDAARSEAADRVAAARRALRGLLASPEAKALQERIAQSMTGEPDAAPSDD